MKNERNNRELGAHYRSRLEMSPKRDRDLSITVVSFYMKIVGFWPVNNHVEQRWRNFATIYTIFAILIAIVVETRDLFFTWGDFSGTVYIMCNLVTIILVLFKILVCFVYKTELLSLIRCKRTCTVLVCVFTFFAQGTVISYMIGPIQANIGRNETNRILPFNVWLNAPIIYMTPYFEIEFIIQILCLYHVGVSYLCFDNILCIINLHTAGQFRILQYRLENMCGVNNNGKLSHSICKYMKLKTYIQQHQMLIEYCKKLEQVFNLIVLGQVSLFSLLMCLDGYLVFTEDAPLTRRLIFLFHITGCMCQLLMFTYSCDCLIRDSTNVANAAYKSLWSFLPMDKYGKILRRDLMLIIMRSNIPCCLTASGFFVVSLETYTGILSTAASYFTLLRNHASDTP
ncbi:odorant receptor 13a-like [Bombus pascuorum]|uniref:odorant receptor 13a-like n=1 Tax=Bombus pascuorum TaxID=65598 RepID=UPI00298EB776|nr:odorant receptor 13a-like [Bombus pascuorum]